jgi:hypothetical protein
VRGVPCCLWPVSGQRALLVVGQCLRARLVLMLLLLVKPSSHRVARVQSILLVQDDRFHYACRVVGFQVQRPKGFAGMLRLLSEAALVTFVALKLMGVTAWSWWWVLSPLWLSVVPFALLASWLAVQWCRDRKPFV